MEHTLCIFKNGTCRGWLIISYWKLSMWGCIYVHNLTSITRKIRHMIVFAVERGPVSHIYITWPDYGIGPLSSLSISTHLRRRAFMVNLTSPFFIISQKEHPQKEQRELSNTRFSMGSSRDLLMLGSWWYVWHIWCVYISPICTKISEQEYVCYNFTSQINKIVHTKPIIDISSLHWISMFDTLIILAGRIWTVCRVIM